MASNSTRTQGRIHFVKRSMILLAGLGVAILGFFTGRLIAPSPLRKASENPSARESPGNLRPDTGGSAWEKAIQREAAIGIQAGFDQGMSFPKVDNTFTAFEHGWRISDRLADTLALSGDERKIAQDAIDASRISFEELVKKNTEFHQKDDSRPDVASMVRIRPFMREGHAALENLHHRLQAQLPPNVADELFKYFRWRPFLGAFGANEVEVTVHQDGSIGYIRRNSMTGASISSASHGSPDALRDSGFDPALFER